MRDARCLPVERCWTEMFLSQMVRCWGMTSVAHHLVLFSAVDRIPLVKCWFCAMIWRNMSRAASLKLRRGPCDLLYWIVCSRWCDACTYYYYCDAFFVNAVSLSNRQIAARHFTETKYLKYPARRTKEMLAILLSARRNFNGVARRSPSESFPQYKYFEGIRSRKMKSSLLSKFLISNRSRARVNVFTADTERILAVVRRWLSSRRDACRRRKQQFVLLQDDLLLFFLIDYAWCMRRLAIDISWIHRFFINAIRRYN